MNLAWWRQCSAKTVLKGLGKYRCDRFRGHPGVHTAGRNMPFARVQWPSEWKEEA